MVATSYGIYPRREHGSMTDDATREQVAVEANDLDQRRRRSGHKSASSQQATSRRNAATVVLLVKKFAHGFEGLAEMKSLTFRCWLSQVDRSNQAQLRTKEWVRW